MKEWTIRCSQEAILVLNWVKHRFSLRVSLSNSLNYGAKIVFKTLFWIFEDIIRLRSGKGLDKWLLYYVYTKVNLFGFITIRWSFKIYTDCTHIRYLKIYSDRGQILMNPIKFESQSNLNKSFADSFQYPIALFVFQVWMVFDAI